MKNKIKKFNEYSTSNDILQDFITGFDSLIKESDDKNYISIQKKVLSDLKINLGIIGTFGAGINSIYPIVEGLLTNIGSIEVTTQTVVLATICALTIVFLEEKKNKVEDVEKLTKDSKFMLEELKMMGVGNGIIKNLIKSFKSIVGVFLTIGKHTGAIVGGFMDMFGYTSLLIPIMNGVSYIIGKYSLTPDTLIQNLIGIGMGVATIIAKRGISFIINNLKIKLPFNKKKIIDELETPIVQKFGDFANDSELDLIKEQ